MKNKSEQEFENEVITYLTQIGGTKQWEYKPDIKTTEQLWDNFKRILEQNNPGRIDQELSETEFSQVKRVINNLDTPYKAGQFLYGINGISEVEVDLDNGKHVYLTVFDQAQVGGGNTVYEVVNQIKRHHVIDGKQNRRFDVTLLINGLPIIQIELKKAMHSGKEAMNQMEQYIAERQFGDIFSTLQILIAMTPYDIRYMANTILANFNTAFAFNWQDGVTAKPVYSWKTFCDKVLSIPMAHNLATQYMILDGTKNKESIKVMRPYQVYATKRVLDKVKKIDFSLGDGQLGYVWHTTGSGKTITSFKTAWLASRMPNVDKVVFLVDRVALTNQTADAYRAYDPAAGFAGNSGIVSDTANVSDLHRKLTKKSDKNIIVTSIQKMSRYVSRDNFKPIKQNILFIVDEAHRSTGDGKDSTGMLSRILQAIPNSAIIGYTGTPKFPETRLIFGNLIHAYTIKEAIADKNVLGFKVTFKETIAPPSVENEDDFDDNIKGSVYDTSPEHVKLVVEDILKNWRERSENKKYNALFTVHVGGNKASTPRAMEYFDCFLEENKKLPENDQIKIAISFSQDTSNGDNQLETNENLFRAIQSYNQMFKTNFDMKTVKAYTEDLARRLNKTSDDRNYLDLVIVVDQLLTGFDAPQLNTLYVDRTLRGGNLIQAYSRTNRIYDSITKPFGNVVNYRWPAQNELEMNKSFAIYSDRNSAAEQLSLLELKKLNQDNGVIAKPFEEVQKETKKIVSDMSHLTDSFTEVPPSEKAKDQLFNDLQEYNRLINQLKQYTEDKDGEEVSVYRNPEIFYSNLGITEEQEVLLTTKIAEEVKEYIAKGKKIDISEVELVMSHIHDVQINYDYLMDLIAKMSDEVHEEKMSEAKLTKDNIHLEIAKSENEQEKSKVRNFVEGIFAREITLNYPAPRTVEEMTKAMEKSQKANNLRLLTDFIRMWGLDDSTTPKALGKIVAKHRLGQEDLDKQGEVSAIMNGARSSYKEIADPKIASLSWIRYRNDFRKALFELAEMIKKGE